jgi:hypothetical protein
MQLERDDTCLQHSVRSPERKRASGGPNSGWETNVKELLKRHDVI